jgi:hypothetical protein
MERRIVWSGPPVTACATEHREFSCGAFASVGAEGPLFREGGESEKSDGDGTCGVERLNPRDEEERGAAQNVFMFIGKRSDQRGKSASLRRGPWTCAGATGTGSDEEVVVQP